MKNGSRNFALILALATGWLGQLTTLAQTPPQYLALKGVGVNASGSIYSSGTDVQVVGSYAYFAWRSEMDTIIRAAWRFLMSPMRPARCESADTRAAPR